MVQKTGVVEEEKGVRKQKESNTKIIWTHNVGQVAVSKTKRNSS